MINHIGFGGRKEELGRWQGGSKWGKVCKREAGGKRICHLGPTADSRRIIIYQANLFMAGRSAGEKFYLLNCFRLHDY